MKTRRPAPALALLFAALAATPAYAETVFKKGSWVLDDSNPKDAAKGVCQAATAGKFGKTAVSLSIVVDKSGVRPLEIFLMPAKGGIGATALVTETRSHTVFHQALLPRTGAADTYWNIPTATQTFLDDLKLGSQLQFKAVNGGKDVLTLSLSGSTATLDELQKRCAKNAMFTIADFEKAFLPENADRFEINRITPEKAKALRDLVATGATALVKVRTVQKELDALDAKFASLLKERSALQTETANLRDRQIPDLVRQKDAAQVLIDRSIGEIADFEARIPQKQDELVGAREEAKVASDRLRPLQAEHNRLLGVLRNAQSRLDSARGNVSSLRNSIDSVNSSISQLNSEVDRLGSDLNRAQDEIRRAETNRDDALRAQRDFDFRRELRDRLQNDWRIEALRKEVRENERKVDEWRNNTQRAQEDVNRAKQALQQCRGNSFDLTGEISGRILAEANGEWVKGQGRGGNNNDGDRDDDRNGRPGKPDKPGKPPRPNPPGPPSPPEEPTPPAPPAPPAPPKPDCSAQESRLNEAKRTLDHAKDRLDNESGDLRRSRDSLEATRNLIEDEVRKMESDLAQRVMDADTFLANARNEKARIQDRIDSILSFDLPRKQNELNQLESRLSNAVAEEDSASSAESNARFTLEDYDNSVDYDTVAGDAARAASRVSEIESAISSMQRGITSRRTLIADQTKLRETLVKRISDSQALLVQKEARLGEVNGALVDYDSQKAEIQARVDAALAELRAVSDSYADVLLN